MEKQNSMMDATMDVSETAGLIDEDSHGGDPPSHFTTERDDQDEDISGLRQRDLLEQEQRKDQMAADLAQSKDFTQK
jgi:hypothetical protein